MAGPQRERTITIRPRCWRPSQTVAVTDTTGTITIRPPFLSRRKGSQKPNLATAPRGVKAPVPGPERRAGCPAEGAGTKERDSKHRDRSGAPRPSRPAVTEPERRAGDDWKHRAAGAERPERRVEPNGPAASRPAQLERQRPERRARRVARSRCRSLNLGEDPEANDQQSGRAGGRVGAAYC